MTRFTVNFFNLNGAARRILCRALLLSAFFSLIFSEAEAQTWSMAVDGKVYHGKDKLAGSIVTLFRNGEQLMQVVTTSNGRFSFDLPPNAEYLIAITKPGFITKKFKINTANVPADRAEAGGFNPFEPDVTLFEMPTAPEISKRVEAILSQPLAIYQYIPGEQNFNYDESYTNAIQAKLSELTQLQKQAEKEALDKAKNAAIEAQKQLEIDKRYKAAIAKGDAAMNSKDYEKAKEGYTEASATKPAEAYPKSKLAEIQKLMANANKQKELDAKYDAAIKKGDDAFKSKDYPTAKTAFTEASALKSSEAYPKTKIAEINKLLVDAAKEKELDAKYNAAITKADASFASKNYASAKTSYTEASAVKPTEAYPKSKLAEIDKLLAEANKTKELDAKYQSAITKADNAFNSKDYPVAKLNYTEAASLKSSEAYPKTKLVEIDKLMKELEAEKEKEQKYKDAIVKGDVAFEKKEYASAKSAFTEAVGLKPAETYPKSKLALIEKIIADKAKAGELEKQYADLIAKADNAFSQKDYANARSAYTDASSLKSVEQHPKTRIVEIDKILASQGKQKEVDTKYDAAIKKGDAAFAQKDYTNAKAGYSEAASLKLSEAYPKTKLAEIDKLLADLAKQQSAADKEKQYNEAIVAGDNSFKAKNYTSAKSSYNQALSIKNGEAYPTGKIAEIDKLLADAGQQKEIEAKYKSAIAAADVAFKNKDYNSAKSGYSNASTIKPNEVYPKTKLAEIEKILSASAASANAQNELEGKYKSAIAKGDKALAAKDYATAKPMYNEALRLKPQESYPKEKLNEIESLLAQQAAAKDQQEAEKQYKEAIARGDKSFAQKDYNSAKLAYGEALTYKPNEEYPQKRIDLIEDIIRKLQLVKAKNTTKNKTPEVKEKPLDPAEKAKIYQDELRAKYPSGVTQEEYTSNGKTILRRVVIKEDFAGVYTRVTHNWGGIYCFRDNTPITEIVFENESK